MKRFFPASLRIFYPTGMDLLPILRRDQLFHGHLPPLGEDVQQVREPIDLGIRAVFRCQLQGLILLVLHRDGHTEIDGLGADDIPVQIVAHIAAVFRFGSHFLHGVIVESRGRACGYR